MDEVKGRDDFKRLLNKKYVEHIKKQDEEKKYHENNWKKATMTEAETLLNRKMMKQMHDDDTFN